MAPGGHLESQALSHGDPALAQQQTVMQCHLNLAIDLAPGSQTKPQVHKYHAPEHSIQHPCSPASDLGSSP